MKVRWWKYHFKDLEYYRFSIYRFGSNMQTVYAYRLGSTLIDTGHSNSRISLKEALGNHKIEQVLLTHYHEDHTGNAAYLKYKMDCPIKAHPICAELMTKGFTVSPLGRLISGHVKKVDVEALTDYETLHFDGFTLQAIPTPGHTPDHLAFYEPNRGWLFSGDLYVADRIKYFETNEDIKQQINSLEILAALDFDVLLCSHNPKLKDGKLRLLRKLELFKTFYDEVIRLHQKGEKSEQILKLLGRKENNFYKYLTVGHFTAVNMVKSVLKAEDLKEH
jgi:glyoxylase-like metal-dependent hydrolase (beta-lactamase superfamily II)